MSNSEVQTIMLILVAFIPLVGLTMALTPRLQPRGEVFSVSVPTSAWDDPRIRRLMNRYVAIVIAATVLFTVAALALCLMGNVEASLAVVVVASLALLAIGYGLILRYRAKVQGLKRACGWVAQSQQHVATIGEGVEQAPRPISLAWNWLYVPLVALTAVVVAVGYCSMPDAIPMHVDVSGNVTDMVPKARWLRRSRLRWRCFWLPYSRSAIGRCCDRRRAWSRAARQAPRGRTGCSRMRKRRFCWSWAWHVRLPAALAWRLP